MPGVPPRSGGQGSGGPCGGCNGLPLVPGKRPGGRPFRAGLFLLWPTGKRSAPAWRMVACHLAARFDFRDHGVAHRVRLVHESAGPIADGVPALEEGDRVARY